MSSFSIAASLLRKITDEKKYFSDILFVFTQSNPFKIIIDKSGRVMNIYNEIAQKDHLVLCWLSLMTMKPSSFESINLTIPKDKCDSEEELFLFIAKNTKIQQKLFVYSHEEWEKFNYCDEHEGSFIIYDGVPVEIFDRDQAVECLTVNKGVVNISNSIVATAHSTISKSSIK